MTSMKNRRKPIFQCWRFVIYACLVHPNLPLQFNRSSVVKLKAQTIFRHLYSEASSLFLTLKVGFRLGQCITDQVFKLTYDVEHRFVENKSGIVLANLTAAQDCLLYGASAKHPTTAFHLVLFLQTKFQNLAKNKKYAFFTKLAE